LVIRPYHPGDESTVRRICFETALFGGPMAGHFDDPQLVSDTLLMYYLHYEPEHISVADAEGRVAGYVAGARDTRVFMRRYALYVAPRLGFDLIGRGHVVRPRSLEVIVAGLRNGSRWARIRRRVVRDYPAHCHVNVDADFRRTGVGNELLERFEAQLVEEHSPGIHVTTETEAGKAFFAAAGFRVLDGYDSPPFWDFAPRRVWVMAKPL
jgi:ribosomal protein S18 acetylase RimI-like enzyme